MMGADRKNPRSQLSKESVRRGGEFEPLPNFLITISHKLETNVDDDDDDDGDVINVNDEDVL